MESALDVVLPSTVATELSPDSANRIVAMCRSRRERVLAEEDAYAQQVRVRDDNAAFLLQIIRGVEDEEAAQRSAVVKAEERALAVLSRQMEDSGKEFEAQLEVLRQRRNLELLKRRKMQHLQAELCHERFRAFWDNHKQQRTRPGAAGAGGPTMLQSPAAGRGRGGSPPRDRDANSVAVWNQLTSVMRRAYEYAAPPFAADPEELWRRGVIVPPDLQSGAGTLRSSNRPFASDSAVAAEVDDMIQKLSLPAYHDFSMKVRQRYQRFVSQAGSPAERLAQTPVQYSPTRGAAASIAPATPFQSYSAKKATSPPSASVMGSSPYQTYVRSPAAYEP